VLALVGAVGFLVVLIASLAVLVPLQRRIISSPDSEALGEMRESAGSAGISDARRCRYPS
jgi:hypothetical protein